MFHRLVFGVFSTIGLADSVLLLCVNATAADYALPNVILIVADDLGLGDLPEGQVFSSPGMHIDIAPASPARTGLKPPRNLDDRNLSPCWRGETRQSLLGALFGGAPGRARSAVRRGDWKSVSDRNQPQGQLELSLYQLSLDAEESKNRMQNKPALARELRILHAQWSQGILTKRKALRPQQSVP